MRTAKRPDTQFHPQMPPMEVQHHKIRDFVFADGTTLPSISVAYVDSNPTATKTALVVSCFRGRLANTWTFATGECTALRDHRVVCVALLGNGESSSPSNTPGFPQATLDYRDCVRAQHHLLTQGLGIAAVDVVVGFSMGGQAAYHWTLMYPDVVANAVVICSSARTSRHNVQFLEGPRAALENAADYVPLATRRLAADPPPPSPCARGLKAFGKAYSAWLTSAEWFEQEAYHEIGFDSHAAWDAAVTGPGYRGWDPEDLLALLRLWQRGDITAVDGKGGSLEDALGHIKARVLLMPCQTDQYFRWYVSEREAKSIPRATLKVIPSIWGHVAGSGGHATDTKWMDERISEFLAAA